MQEPSLFRWKAVYNRTLEITFILTLLIIITVFYSFRKYDGDYALPPLDPVGPTTAINIPPTVQLKKLPRPPLPSIPVEADEDEMTDAETIDFEEMMNSELAMDIPLPEPEDEPPYQFYQVSEKPEVIEKVKPVYPEMARRAGISGTVVITVLIGKKGEVEQVKVFKEVVMLTDAAIQAAWKCKFKPAKQRDKFVKVWMNVPFVFNLR